MLMLCVAPRDAPPDFARPEYRFHLRDAATWMRRSAGLADVHVETTESNQVTPSSAPIKRFGIRVRAHAQREAGLPDNYIVQFCCRGPGGIKNELRVRKRTASPSPAQNSGLRLPILPYAPMAFFTTAINTPDPTPAAKPRTHLPAVDNASIILAPSPCCAASFAAATELTLANSCDDRASLATIACNSPR